jgi:hypothetical protein
MHSALEELLNRYNHFKAESDLRIALLANKYEAAATLQTQAGEAQKRGLAARLAIEQHEAEAHEKAIGKRPRSWMVRSTPILDRTTRQSKRE